jgi:CubicO group peptidase (beta-lactamase class C family)
VRPSPERFAHAPRVLALAALLVGACAPAEPSVDTRPTIPGVSWEAIAENDLPAYGWDPAGLEATTAFLADSATTTALVVVENGRVAYTYGDIERVSYLASVRKSILAMLYGVWVEDGTVDLDATLEDLEMDDVGGLLPVERQATVGDLVTARSGVYHPASNSGDNLADAPERGSQTPGEYMLYSNWDFNAAGGAFELITGRDIFDELERQLAGPLQFEHFDRGRHQKGGNLDVSVYPSYHMHLSTVDMARVGLLMLYEGNWGGEQLIPAEWTRRISSVVTPLEEMNPVARRDGYFGYGYMWWVWDGPRAAGPFEGAYTGRGAYGQWITVMPAVDLVVVHKTDPDDGTTSWDAWHRMLELVLTARGIEMPGPWPWDPSAD